MVVRIAQDTEEFQPQYPPQGIRYFDGVGICRSCFQTVCRQGAQMVTGLFVAAFMTVEPGFQIVLVGGVFDKGQRIEVFRGQVADDVDADRFAAVFVLCRGLFRQYGT